MQKEKIVFDPEIPGQDQFCNRFFFILNRKCRIRLFTFLPILYVRVIKIIE